MSKNGNDANYTNHIAIRVYFVINVEKWKMQKIDCFEGGLKLADIKTKNALDNDLNPRIKYIILRLNNWYKTLVR